MSFEASLRAEQHQALEHFHFHPSHVTGCWSENNISFIWQLFTCWIEIFKYRSFSDQCPLISLEKGDFIWTLDTRSSHIIDVQPLLSSMMISSLQKEEHKNQTKWLKLTQSQRFHSSRQHAAFYLEQEQNLTPDQIINALLLWLTRWETSVFRHLSSSDTGMPFFLFLSSGSKWRDRALPGDLINSIACCSQSELSSHVSTDVHCKLHYGVSTCLCKRRTLFLTYLVALFEFLKVLSAQTRAGRDEIRRDEWSLDQLIRTLHTGEETKTRRKRTKSNMFKRLLSSFLKCIAVCQGNRRSELLNVQNTILVRRADWVLLRGIMRVLTRVVLSLTEFCVRLN